MTISLLFVGKRNDPHCEKAVAFVRRHFREPQIHLALRGDPWSGQIDHWHGDYIISYLSPFVIPQSVLDRAGRAAINFHPGPPNYPGVGCTNFAIYNRDVEFGVTCHRMAARVDTGPIIAVRRFPLYPDDTVLSLTQRCYVSILELFHEIIAFVLDDKPLPRSDETWQRKPHRRHELDELCRITPDMPADEVARRVRAVTFPGAPGAFVEIHGHRFEHDATASPSPAGKQCRETLA